MKEAGGALNKARELYERICSDFKQEFGSDTVLIETDRAGCPVFWVEPSRNIEALKYFKEKVGFSFLSDLTAYDLKGTEEESLGRFVIVYNLFSPESLVRLRLKVRVSSFSGPCTASVLWEAANWAEREVYDLFGIQFEGHPNMRRILMDIRWEGHPLQKDYPLKKAQLFNDPEPIPLEQLKD